NSLPKMQVLLGVGYSYLLLCLFFVFPIVSSRWASRRRMEMYLSRLHIAPYCLQTRSCSCYFQGTTPQDSFRGAQDSLSSGEDGHVFSYPISDFSYNRLLMTFTVLIFA